MPAQYDLPEYQEANSIEDVNSYNKLPFYLAAMGSTLFPKWDTYNKLFGKMNWTSNSGTTMKAVAAEYSPIGRVKFYPNSITSTPKKDVFGTTERTEQCNVKIHDADTKQFSFLPSWQDFRENQIDFSHDNVVRNISINNEAFVQTVMWEKAPYVYIVGNNTVGEQELIPAPAIAAGTDITAANSLKTTAWTQAMLAKVGGQGLGLASLDRMVMTLRDDLRAPAFEGTLNTPKDNELIKGKYVLVGSMEAYQMFKWDPNMALFRSVDWNILIDGFSGTPFGNLTYKSQCYPWRIAADGSFPAPEIAGDDGGVDVNPNYKNAPFEVAWLLGADAYKTIKIGPPPKPFAGGKMDPSVFAGMSWNGEVQLTKNFLIQYAVEGGGVTLDTNSRGRFVKLQSSQTMGCLATRARNAIPVIYRRARPAIQAA